MLKKLWFNFIHVHIQGIWDETWNVDIGFSLISMIKYFKSVFFFKYSHFTLFDFFGQNTEYKGEYYRQHPTIRLFWEVFHELTIQLKKKFLCKCCRKERKKKSMSVITLFWHVNKSLDTACISSQTLYRSDALHLSYNFSDILKHESEGLLKIQNHLNSYSCKLFNIVLYPW